MGRMIGLSVGLLLPIALTAAAAPAERTGEGYALSQACTSCHGIDGRGGGAIPAIAGRPAPDLLDLLHELRRPDAAMDASATIMPRLLRGYDDAQLEALAAYFAQVAP